jgi:hypothetical protein
MPTKKVTRKPKALPWIKYPNRLLKLADIAEQDANNKKGVSFTMGRWGQIDSEKPIKTAKMTCGTRACLFGLAALSRGFKSQGLGFTLQKNSEYVSYSGKRIIYGIEFTWKGRYIDPLSAAAKLFGIDKATVHALFIPFAAEMEEGAKAERAGAKVLRQFVKTGKVTWDKYRTYKPIPDDDLL